MPRPSIAIALPPDESVPVATELREAGFNVITVNEPDELEALLASTRDVGVAILDGETLRFLPIRLSAFLIVGGMVVGSTGGLAAAWRAGSNPR